MEIHKNKTMVTNISRTEALKPLYDYVNKHERFPKQYIYFYMTYNTAEKSWGFVGRKYLYVLSPKPHKQALCATDKQQMQATHEAHTRYFRSLKKKPQLKSQRINGYLDTIQENLDAIRRINNQKRKS